MTIGHVLENGKQSEWNAFCPICIWTENDDGAFETSCGEAFEFTNAGPKENKFRHCPYCGKRLDTQNAGGEGREV